MRIRPVKLCLHAIVRRHWQIALVLATLSPAYFYWTWTDQIGSLGSDAPAYLVMARQYSGDSRYADPGTAVAASLSRFPPLYPIALARFHAVDDLHRAHLLTMAFFMLALLAWYGYLRQAGALAGEAALLVLLPAVLPGSWLLALSPQSEFPYLLFSGLALLFLARHQRQRRDETLYAASLAIAAAILTRSVGVTLLAPLLIALFRVGGRQGPLALLLALAPGLLWHAVHRSPVGYIDSLRLHYGDGAAPSWWAQLETTLSALRLGWAGNFTQVRNPGVVLDGLAVLCLAGMVLRAWRLKPDAVYLVAYLAVLLIWSYPDESERFLWALLPPLLAQPLLAFEQWRGSARSTSRPRLAVAVMAAVVLAMALPEVSAAAERFLAADDSVVPGAQGMRSWYQADLAKAARRTAGEALVIGMLRRMADEVPPGECVISIRPDLVNYFAGRLAAWPPLDSVPEPEFSRQLHGAHCRYLFMTTASYAGYPVPLHPLQRLNERVDVIDYREVPVATPGDGRIICVLAKFPGESVH